VQCRLSKRETRVYKYPFPSLHVDCGEATALSEISFGQDARCFGFFKIWYFEKVMIKESARHGSRDFFDSATVEDWRRETEMDTGRKMP
jgi:hypothetical protein